MQADQLSVSTELHVTFQPDPGAGPFGEVDGGVVRRPGLFWSESRPAAMGDHEGHRGTLTRPGYEQVNAYPTPGTRRPFSR